MSTQIVDTVIAIPTRKYASCRSETDNAAKPQNTHEIRPITKPILKFTFFVSTVEKYL